MTTTTLDQARSIRAALTTPRPAEAGTDVPTAEGGPRMWFRKPRHENVRTVDAAAIFDHADLEYLKWRTPEASIEHSCDMEARLSEWVQGMTDAGLAQQLDTTPAGLTADPHTGASYRFTAFQRLLMLYWADQPISVTARVHVSTEALRALAYPPGDGGSKRRMPIGASLTLHAGAPRTAGINDLGTGCGKAGWACAVACMMLDPLRFPRVLAHARLAARGTITQCASGVGAIARVALIAVSGATFQHMLDTLHRVLPAVRAMTGDADFTWRVWSSLGKGRSIDAAAALPGATLWIVPVGRLNEVLRDSPTATVAVCVTDEFTVDTPREKFKTSQAHVLHHIITQATPQALVRATSGTGSWLRTIMDGAITPPRVLHSLIKNRHFNTAQTAAWQFCQLALMTTTPFRAHVRDELIPLMPRALEVAFVPSRRVTFASLLARRTSDIVPSSLCNVILQDLAPLRRAPESRTQLVAVLTSTDEPSITPATLVEEVRKIVPTAAHHVESNALLVDRLIERLTEFASECPVCFSDDTNGMRLCARCGHIVCTACHNASCRVNGAGSARCAFCRASIPAFLTRQEATSADWVTPAREPQVKMPTSPPQPGPTVAATLAQTASPAQAQMVNLSHALLALRAHGYRRTLVVVECDTHVLGYAVEYLHIEDLCKATGWDIVLVDNLINGKGSGFEAVKRRFDTPNPAPMALLSYSRSDRFLTGTDLTYADSIVTVGDIAIETLTQALGRLFRPRASRDNTRSIAMVRVYSDGAEY